MKNYKRILAGLLAGASIMSLAGCSGGVFTGEDARSLPLVAPLTVGEVKEYYAKSLDFDSVITRNVDPHVTKYELHPVDSNSETASKLTSAIRVTLGLLNRMEYKFDPDYERYLQESTFHYIKAFLNDRVISDTKIISINEALGYYFVDVSAKVSAGTPGTFKPTASLLGLNGAIHYYKTEDEDRVETAYMEMAVKTLNDYYEENRITTKHATFDAASNIFSTDPTIPASSFLDFTQTTATDNQVAAQTAEPEPTQDESGQNDSETNEDANADGNGDESAEGTENNDTEDSGTPIDLVDPDSQNKGSVATPFTGLKIRRPIVDVYEFNSVVGSSLRSSAYIPKLDMVYEIPAAKDGQSISGMGIMPAGLGGLTKFGFDRSQLDGDITIRFVYKDELLDPSKVICTNIYPVILDIKTGFSSNNDNVIPSFVEEEIEKLIERADRAMINNDIMALMSGDIFADMGMAVQIGYERQYSNVIRQISKFRRVISRDIGEKCYLIEVETQRQEGPKEADVYGVYRDKNYVVVQQVGEKFVITDWFNIQRQLESEPDIDPDSAITKRLVALNLAGEVSDSEKESATELLRDLYLACTYRRSSGPSEVTGPNGEKIQLEKGMYDCFNSNVEMLSSEKKENLNSALREMLLKEGTDRKAQLNGIVTEWIGGADNQVEFMTEEIITYTGLNKGIYMQCYYLISKMEDVWVIDDIKIIEKEEHEGTQLENDIDRIGTVSARAITSSSNSDAN